MNATNGRCFELVDDPDLLPEPWLCEDYLDLRGDSSYADRGTEVIEGLLRAGEVLLLGSSSKHGKSWLVGNLIWAAIQGEAWLGKNVRQGKVLLIDNELKRCELDWRHAMIAREMHYEPCPGDLAIISRRGKSCDILSMSMQLRELDFDWREYSLIVIDAIYKCIPGGASENDNSAMGALMNSLQGIAEDTSVPVVGVHHSTKGGQGDKAVLDVFAGAGSFGRALDSAVVIRDHEQPDLSVIDFVSRTSPPQEAISARFDWPLWTVVTATPEVKRVTRQNQGQQSQSDQTASQLLLEKIPYAPKLVQQVNLFSEIEGGVGRIKRLVKKLIIDGKIREVRRKRKGAKQVKVFYQRNSENDSESHSDSATGITRKNDSENDSESHSG